MGLLNKHESSGSVQLFSQFGSVQLFDRGGSVGQHNPVAQSLNIIKPPVEKYGVSITSAPSSVVQGDTVDVSVDVVNEVDLEQDVTVELIVDAV